MKSFSAIQTKWETSIMLKLDGMNIIIQLKVQIYQNIFKSILPTVLQGLLFQMLQKWKDQEELGVSYIVLWKPDLNKQKFFERQFYLKMVSHSAINERIQTS